MQSLLLVTASIAITLTISGCSNTSSQPVADQPTAKESPNADEKPANVYCVLMADHEASPKRIRQHEGKTVGLCCEKCMPDWDKMSDALKAEALEQALAKNGARQ